MIYCMNWITISSTWCELLWIRRRLAVRGCSTVPVTLVRWTLYAGHCRRSPGSRRSHRTRWGLERGVHHMGITICHFHIISIITYINYHLFLQVYAEYCAYVFLAIGFFLYIYTYIITIILATHTHIYIYVTDHTFQQLNPIWVVSRWLRRARGQSPNRRWRCPLSHGGEPSSIIHVCNLYITVYYIIYYVYLSYAVFIPLGISFKESDGPSCPKQNCSFW